MSTSESRGSPPQRTGVIPGLSFEEHPVRTGSNRPSPVSQTSVSVDRFLFYFLNPLSQSPALLLLFDSMLS